MGLGCLESAKQCAASGGFRYIDDRTDITSDGHCRQIFADGGFIRDQFEQVLDIDDAGNVVQILFVDRQPGESGFDRQRRDIGNSCCFFDRDDVCTVGHHIPGRVVVKLEDVFDHLLLALFNRAHLAAGIHHQPDILFGDGFLFVFRLAANAKQSANPAGDQPDDSAQREKYPYKPVHG